MAEEQQPPEEESSEAAQDEKVEETAEAKPEEVVAEEAAPETEPKEAEAPPKEKEEVIDEVTTLHERTIAALSYFGFLAIVPFYLKKDSKFCRYHGKQGLTFAIIFFLAKLIAVLDLIMDLTLILQAIIALWMGFAALSGRWKKAPFIYKWSCKLEDALSLKTAEEEKDVEKLKPNQLKKEEVPVESGDVKAEEPEEDKKS